MLLVVYVVLATIGSAWVGRQLLGENSSWVQLALGLLFVTSLLAQFIYAYHLFKLRRWTMVPSMAFAFISIVAAYQSFYLPLLPGQEWTRFLGIALAGWFSFVALLSVLHYRQLNSVRWGRAWAGLLIFVLLPYLGFAAATLVIRDIPNVDDADLLVGMVSVVPEEDNIHYALPDLEELDPEVDAIIERIDSEVIEARRNDTEISSTTLGLLATPPMQALLQQYLTALERPYYQCPASVNSLYYDTPLCSLNNYRMFGRLANFEAERLLKEGSVEQSVQYVVATLKLADALQGEQLPLIQYLVAIALLDLSYDTIDSLYSVSQPTSGATTVLVTNQIINALESYQPDQESLGFALRSDYTATANSINSEMIADEFDFNVQPSYFWQPNRTKQAFADLSRKSVHYSQLSCGVGTGLKEELAQDALAYRTAVNDLLIFMPNSLGRLFLAVTASSFTGTRDHYCEAAARHEALLADFQELREQAVAQSATTTADTIPVE